MYKLVHACFNTFCFILILGYYKTNSDKDA